MTSIKIIVSSEFTILEAGLLKLELLLRENCRNKWFEQKQNEDETNTVKWSEGAKCQRLQLLSLVIIPFNYSSCEILSVHKKLIFLQIGIPTDPKTVVLWNISDQSDEILKGEALKFGL